MLITWHFGWIPISLRGVNWSIMINSTRQNIRHTFAFMIFTLFNRKHREVVVMVIQLSFGISRVSIYLYARDDALALGLRQSFRQPPDPINLNLEVSTRGANPIEMDLRASKD